MIAGLALTRALVAGLAADGVLAARGGVYDVAPPGAEPPYLTVGPNVATDWSTKSGEGREHRFRVTVWEGPYAAARAADTMERVEAVVAALPRALEGHRLVSLRFLRSFVASERAGGAVEGVVEFRARTQAV